MKVCHKEAMKAVKELEQQKAYLLRSENRLCSVTFKDGEEKPSSDYNYKATRKEIARLDGEIRRIKQALAVANCAVKIDDFNITIGEALILLAQLNNEHAQLERLAEEVQLSRSITQTGIVVHRECLYDVKTAAKDADALNKKINKLQVALDRANLVNFVEI